MPQRCHLFALLTCILLSGCLGLQHNITSTDVVSQIYFQKMDKHGLIGSVDVSRFGERAFTLISFFKHGSPPIADCLIFTRERKFLDMNFDNLRATSLKEFQKPMTPDDRKAFIAAFPEVLWAGKVISDISDIPKYKSGSLPPNIEQAITPPDYSIDSITVYTFAALGGRVNTFTFTFTPDGRLAGITHNQLGERIGEHFFLR